MMMMLQWILLSNWNHLSSLHVQMADTKSISFNLLDSKGNYNATSNNMKLVHWLLMDGLLHLVQEGGAWAGCGPAQSPPRCTKCNSPRINGQCTNDCIAI